MIQYSKLQIGCLFVVLYITFVYISEWHMYRLKKREPIFEALLITGILEIIFDAATAYTVNHMDTVPAVVNGVLHMCFLCAVDMIVFLMFFYILDITKGVPKGKRKQALLWLPIMINIAIVILFMPQLSYRQGTITNYSMGISAYTCFIMVAVYMLAILVLLFMSWKLLDKHKLVTITTCMLGTVGLTVYQMLHPQALLTSLGPTIVIMGMYLNMENPVFSKLQTYHQEMVRGFASLVENRDSSTGGHIKRTTEYVRMLAEELRTRGFYQNELTKDYIENLVMAAPMHDVGKIAIPDAILQKPGKLTDEEYDMMKTHAAKGGELIKENFGHMGDEKYQRMAYEVARYHHEKWNGRGYPEKLEEENIPLCARIMAVADVFDAVSAKRCYRDALPLEKCFSIIEEGRGADFDPVIAQVFLDIRDRVREIYEKQDFS